MRDAGLGRNTRVSQEIRACIVLLELLELHNYLVLCLGKLGKVFPPFRPRQLRSQFFDL
jgi:hypothetical protein